jgi:hypothetical protein
MGVGVFTAESVRRRGRKWWAARFTGAPVVAMVKLAELACSVFMSAEWKLHFTDLSVCSVFCSQVSTQNGDGPFGFEDGEMNTVGVEVPVLAEHRL